MKVLPVNYRFYAYNYRNHSSCSLVLWLLGVIGLFTIGKFIHVLLVVAIIMILIRLIRGENPIK